MGDPDAVGWSPEQIKEFIGALLSEKDRALTMADDEREKAASALRSEQQRREDQAEREREKAAENLRIELARSIKEGDERLREHILNQIMQINAALISAEKLEVERLSRLDARVDSVVETQEVLRQAAHETQAEFKGDVKDRFASVNEFRNALDDLGKQMATRRELETGLTSLSALVEAARQERQHQIDDLRSTLSELRSRLDVGAPQIPELQKFVAATSGRQEGQSAERNEGRATISMATAVVGATVAAIILLLAILNFVSLHENTPPAVTVTVPTTAAP